MEEKPSFDTVEVSPEYLEKVDKCLKHNKFASVLFQAGKLEPAEKHFLKAAELAAEISLPYSNVLQNLGNLYAQMKNYQPALDHYSQVIAQSPHNPQNPLSQTPLNSIKGQLLFEPRLNSKEAFVDAHTNISFTYLGIGKPDKAAEFCKAAIQLNPANKEAYINFGNSLRQLGKREESIRFTLDLVERDVQTRKENPAGDFKIQRLNLDEVKQTQSPADPAAVEQVTIITVKWGTKYNADYVNKLYRGFKRNCSREFRFVCFTDDANGLDENIEPRKLIEDWKGWWGKASIFSRDHQIAGLKFFIDLDMVITGSLDDLLDFKGKFALLRTDELYCETLNKQGYNSSILLWRDDYFEPIYTCLKACYHELAKYIYRFDYWLEMMVQNAEFVQELFPGQVLDYTAECQDDQLQDGTRIVAFPRDPKPHEVTHKAWMQLHWV